MEHADSAGENLQGKGCKTVTERIAQAAEEQKRRIKGSLKAVQALELVQLELITGRRACVHEKEPGRRDTKLHLRPGDKSK